MIHAVLATHDRLSLLEMIVFHPCPPDEDHAIPKSVVRIVRRSNSPSLQVRWRYRTSCLIRSTRGAGNPQRCPFVDQIFQVDETPGMPVSKSRQVAWHGSPEDSDREFRHETPRGCSGTTNSLHVFLKGVILYLPTSSGLILEFVAQ